MAHPKEANARISAKDAFFDIRLTNVDNILKDNNKGQDTDNINPFRDKTSPPWIRKIETMLYLSKKGKPSRSVAGVDAREEGEEKTPVAGVEFEVGLRGRC